MLNRLTPIWSPDSRYIVKDLRAAKAFPRKKFFLLAIMEYQPERQALPVTKLGETEQTEAQINTVLNWIDELKQRVPVR